MTRLCLGHQYQGFDVRYNYIAFNYGEYRNTISAFGVQLNFTTNIVFSNQAQCILNASVLEKVVWFTHTSYYITDHCKDPSNTSNLLNARTTSCCFVDLLLSMLYDASSLHTLLFRVSTLSCHVLFQNTADIICCNYVWMFLTLSDICQPSIRVQRNL